MKKYTMTVVIVAVALLVGLVIGSMATFRSLPADRTIRVNLLGKGEDLGTIRISVEKRNTGGVCEQLITASDGEPVIGFVNSAGGTGGKFPKETVTAHLIRRDGGSLQLVWND